MKKEEIDKAHIIYDNSVIVSLLHDKDEDRNLINSILKAIPNSYIYNGNDINAFINMIPLIKEKVLIFSYLRRFIFNLDFIEFRKLMNEAYDLCLYNNKQLIITNDTNNYSLTKISSIVWLIKNDYLEPIKSRFFNYKINFRLIESRKRKFNNLLKNSGK